MEIKITTDSAVALIADRTTYGILAKYQTGFFTSLRTAGITHNIRFNR